MDHRLPAFCLENTKLFSCSRLVIWFSTVLYYRVTVVTPELEFPGLVPFKTHFPLPFRKLCVWLNFPMSNFTLSKNSQGMCAIFELFANCVVWSWMQWSFECRLWADEPPTGQHATPAGNRRQLSRLDGRRINRCNHAPPLYIWYQQHSQVSNCREIALMVILWVHCVFLGMSMAW